MDQFQFNDTELNRGKSSLVIHEEGSHLLALIKAGLPHVQFETVHPFLDGNGRIGRLLVTLYLCVKGVQREPLLNPSLFLKDNRTEYCRLLQEVREEGTWAAWLEFFVIGVAETANHAFEAGSRIVDLFKSDRDRITAEVDRTGSALRILDQFQQNPFLTANQLVEHTGLTAPTVNAALADMERLKIVSEVNRSATRACVCVQAISRYSERGDKAPTLISITGPYRNFSSSHAHYRKGRVNCI